ncbi:hypothetical protein V5N11_034721 [Cardamine amara subsp. amara]|uniref:Uncharacterized protein n=1 Tax=Cardamine amara subsp. amara TaxID=228776 RepID=A0ABD1BIC8_CARAN
MEQGTSASEEDCFSLLNQFEDVLQSDPLIDEVGFIHPSQFTMLDKEAFQPNNRTSRNFWNQRSQIGNINQYTYSIM